MWTPWKRGGVVAQLLSPAVLGLETSTVQVEVDLRAGLPSFSVVGLADAAVQEARERVRSGLANQAFTVPARRIIANLAPADLRKAGPQYDLPIALAILAASGQLSAAALAGLGAVGELALDGALRPGARGDRDGRARRASGMGEDRRAACQRRRGGARARDRGDRGAAAFGRRSRCSRGAPSAILSW